MANERLGHTILVVEDDDQLRGVVARSLREEGFAVEVAATGSDALELVSRMPLDLLVVDIGLPDTDGRDLCQALRARGIRTPVLFLPARDAPLARTPGFHARDPLVDRIAGFDAGGDDYLTKPFALVELVVRISAILRRSGGDSALEAAGLRLDPVRHAVADDEGEVLLTPTEFRMLAALLGRPGDAVRRRELARAGWPHGTIVRENTLDAYVARLRRKLKDLDAAPEIATVHGVGYRIA